MKSIEAETDRRAPSELVIEAVAEYADVDPLDFDVPLGQVIDPDALDSLFASQFGSGRQEGRVEFTYQEYRVTVVSGLEDVSVEVAPVDGADSSADPQEA